METSLPLLSNSEVLHLQKLFLNNMLCVFNEVFAFWQEDSVEKQSVSSMHIVTEIQIFDLSNIHFRNNDYKRQIQKLCSINQLIFLQPFSVSLCLFWIDLYKYVFTVNCSIRRLRLLWFYTPTAFLENILLYSYFLYP